MGVGLDDNLLWVILLLRLLSHVLVGVEAVVGVASDHGDPQAVGVCVPQVTLVLVGEILDLGPVESLRVLLRV